MVKKNKVIAPRDQLRSLGAMLLRRQGVGVILVMLVKIPSKVQRKGQHAHGNQTTKNEHQQCDAPGFDDVEGCIEPQHHHDK